VSVCVRGAVVYPRVPDLGSLQVAIVGVRRHQ